MNTWRREETIRENQYLAGITFMMVNRIPPRPSANATDNMNVLYGLSSGSGQGDFAAHAVRIIRVATGDVQVSVVWDAPTDVDLRVTDPSGEQVYFGNLQSQSGGFLDLDSNP
ncbi:MAG: hypothetical protein IH802_07870, partial [Nitrospinae bacterium]|nr:hypothetical protein [Nitrospinota bacterium]